MDNNKLSIIPAPGGQYRQLGLSEIKDLAGVMVSAKMFTDLESASTAFVKILAGQEIGISPFQAVSGIHVIKGRATLSANLMASKVRENGRYDYRVVVLDDNICHIDFYTLTPKREKLGESRFTKEDAQKAGTQNMGRFPKNMLFARAMSNGVKWYCPDIFGGAPVYVEGEIIEHEDGTHEEIETADQIRERLEAEKLAKRKEAAKAGERVEAKKGETGTVKAVEVDEDNIVDVPRTGTKVAEYENHEIGDDSFGVIEPPVETVTDPAEDTGEEPLHTDDQRKKAMAIMGNLGFKTDQEKRQIVAGLLGKNNLLSFKEVTKAEASSLIEKLQEIEATGDAEGLRVMFITGDANAA